MATTEIRSSKKRGRPERDPIEVFRTKLWARSVAVAAKIPANKLEPILGSDGRWLGVWGRYDKGLVSPSRERLRRIEKKLPGTSRYYFCPIWGLLHQAAFARSDIRDAVTWLSKPVQDAFLSSDASRDGPFWRKPGHPLEVLKKLTHLISNTTYGLDALVAILIVLREAELCQDAWLYLYAARAWADVDNRKEKHPVLRYFPTELVASVLTPLETIHFADTEAEWVWSKVVAQYRAKRKMIPFSLNPNSEIIDIVLTIPAAQINTEGDPHSN